MLNKAEIARQLGVTPSYIAAIMKGRRKAPKMRARIEKLIEKELKAA